MRPGPAEVGGMAGSVSLDLGIGLTGAGAMWRGWRRRVEGQTGRRQDFHQGVTSWTRQIGQSCYHAGRCGEIAQLVEHRTENAGVAGSSPALAITTMHSKRPLCGVASRFGDLSRLMCRSGGGTPGCRSAARWGRQAPYPLRRHPPLERSFPATGNSGITPRQAFRLR